MRNEIPATFDVVMLCAVQNKGITWNTIALYSLALYYLISTLKNPRKSSISADFVIVSPIVSFHEKT